MPYYSQISFHSQYHALLSATSSVKSNGDCRSHLPLQLDWASTSQSIHINNVRWWCLEHGIPHDPSGWKFSAALLYCKLAGGWLSSPHWRGQWWGRGNVRWAFEHFLLVSVVLLYSLLLGIRYRKETFVAGCLRWWKWWWIKISVSVLFGYAGSATGVTSLTRDLRNFVHPFVQLYSIHSTNIYTRHRLLNWAFQASTYSRRSWKRAGLSPDRTINQTAREWVLTFREVSLQSRTMPLQVAIWASVVAWVHHLAQTSLLDSGLHRWHHFASFEHVEYSNYENGRPGRLKWWL